jgi:molybdate transport system substrate-binding protein
VILDTRRIILITVICLAVMMGVLAVARAGAAKKTTLLVHSGAALRPALDELGAMFEKKTGIKIDYNYKGSACLLPDVCLSKKGDVYLPGELYFMKQAEDRKIVKPGYKVVATMTTVIITQPGNPKGIKKLADLGRKGLRLGLGDPEAVAIGRAARECLVKAKIWKQAEKNLTMSAQNVSELSNAVKMKQLDAAIVWDATAAMYNAKEMAVIRLPDNQAVCSPVPVGLVTFTQQAKSAQRYVDFLASAEATKVFVKHGFGAPPAVKACPTGKP